MSATCPQYRILYRLRDSRAAFVCDDGPFDYRCNAIGFRDRFFGRNDDVVACWVEKEGVPTGKVLERT